VAVIGAAIFAAILWWDQRNRSDLHWWRDPISAYLAGPDGHLMAAGFFCMSGALLAIANTAPPLPAALLIAGAFGTALAAITRAFARDRTLHLIGARIAYGCAGIGMLLDSSGTGRIFFGAGIVVAAAIAGYKGHGARWASEWSLKAIGKDITDLPTAWIERTVLAVYLVWVGIWAATHAGIV